MNRRILCVRQRKESVWTKQMLLFFSDKNPMSAYVNICGGFPRRTRLSKIRNEGSVRPL